MNTRQLQCALDSDPAMKDYSRNVFALDQFQRVNLSDKGIFVCNDQPSKKSGNHWFLIFIDPEKIYFVDSFANEPKYYHVCLLYTSPSPRDQRGSRMPSSA